MSLEQSLLDRSESKCELCNSEINLSVYEIPPHSDGSEDQAILICETCQTQIENADLDANHWRCLNDAMWKPVPAIQVVSWRLLKQLSGNEAWALELLDMLYLDEETQAWAEATQPQHSDADPSFDSNGAQLFAGDSVTLIKDLDVKGANFTAKRGTLVKNISLTDNPEHIEGKVNGTRIVLLTKFLKKAN
jgi:protein PhnA